jgi:uncharacterized protein RhaS with RHS repeats
MRARYYDPATEQFISRDPQEATTGQPYVYANRNPINFVDPHGALPRLVLADVGPEEQDWGKGLGSGRAQSGSASTPGGGSTLAARAAQLPVKVRCVPPYYYLADRSGNLSLLVEEVEAIIDVGLYIPGAKQTEVVSPRV